MRSCLILGSGRSGTSMVTGTLARAGYFMGEDLYPARTANPKGFFEGPEINGINEALLAPVAPPAQRLGENQRWLAILPEDAEVRATPELDARIRRAVARAPFCFKDPRFCYTLPAWRPHLGDAGMVCVFRHPLTTASSLAKEVRTAAYLEGVPFGPADALALWTAMYRQVVHRHAKTGDWLFLHYDQVLTPDGVARIGAFLGVEPDLSFPDKLLQRPPPEGDAGDEARALYAELCALAGFVPEDRARAPRAATPDVSVVALAERPEDVRGLAEALKDQRNLRCELVVVDLSGALAAAPPAGVAVVPAPSLSRGAAWKAGAAAARGRYVALAEPGCMPLPAQYAHALAALDAAPDADGVVSDFWLSRPPEAFVSRVDPTAKGDAPPPGWRGGLVLRPGALASMREEAFFPAELDLYRRLRAAGRILHVAEPLYHLDAGVSASRASAARAEAALLDAHASPWEGAPAISVVLCTWNRRAVLAESLDAFCRQVLPLGAFEIVLVDDGSADGTETMLAPLSFAVPVTRLRQENAGLAAARNAGIAAARGHYLHFVNDDTIPAPDCLAEHVAAHRAHPGERIAVLGSFEQPPEALGNALMRATETGRVVFCFSDLKPGELHHPQYFYTCNVTVPAEAVRAVGGFDPAFRHYGGEDTDLGLRLGEFGYRVLYHPKARARHRHLYDLDYLARRGPAVARAHVRLFRKHPQHVDVFGVHERTVADLQALLARRAAVDPKLDAAARTLAPLDLAALEALGETWRAFAEQAAARLQAVLNERNGGWWVQGYLDGLTEHGLSGFPELLAAHPIAPTAGRGALLFPSREAEGAWREALAAFLAGAGPGDGTLVVKADAAAGYGPSELVDVARAAGRDAIRARARRGDRHRPDVVVLESRMHPGHDVRLLAGGGAWIPTGGPGDARLRRLAAPARAREVALPASASSPWPLATSAAFRLLAWPRWDDPAELEATLARFGRPLVARSASLCLRLDPDRDGPADVALTALQEAAARALPDDDRLDVLVVDDRLGPDDLRRLGAAVDAVAELPSLAEGARTAFRDAVGAPVLAAEALGAAVRAAEDAVLQVRVATIG